MGLLKGYEVRHEFIIEKRGLNGIMFLTLLHVRMPYVGYILQQMTDIMPKSSRTQLTIDQLENRIRHNTISGGAKH